MRMRIASPSSYLVVVFDREALYLHDLVVSLVVLSFILVFTTIVRCPCDSLSMINYTVYNKQDTSTMACIRAVNPPDVTV